MQLGPWQNANFFPISVFWQAPTVDRRPLRLREKINIFLGISGLTGPGIWPEPDSALPDSGELEAIKANGLYLIGGVDTPYLEDTSADSVASMLALASRIGAQSNLVGYQASDEPACSGSVPKLNEYGYPPLVSQVPTVMANLHAYDPTRLVSYNETAAWPLSPQYAGCLSALVTGLQDTSVASFDFYPVTRPYFREEQTTSPSRISALSPTTRSSCKGSACRRWLTSLDPTSPCGLLWSRGEIIWGNPKPTTSWLAPSAWDPAPSSTPAAGRSSRRPGSA